MKNYMLLNIYFYHLSTVLWSLLSPGTSRTDIFLSESVSYVPGLQGQSSTGQLKHPLWDTRWKCNKKEQVSKRDASPSLKTPMPLEVNWVILIFCCYFKCTLTIIVSYLMHFNTKILLLSSFSVALGTFKNLNVAFIIFLTFGKWMDYVQR